MEGSGQLQCLSWFRAVCVPVAQVDLCRICVVCVFVCVCARARACVCVCVGGGAYELTGLIRVVIFQQRQNPHSAARSVALRYHLERLKVDRFPIFCQVKTLQIKPLVGIAKMRYRNHDVP